MDEIKVSQLDVVDEIKDTDQIMLVTGGANKKVLGNYINEHGVKIGSSEPDTSQKVWFKQGKNLFGNYKILCGWIDGTTMRINYNNGNRIAVIPCQPNTTYTISRSVITGSFRVGDYTSIPTITGSNIDYTLAKACEKLDSGTTITYTTSSTAKYLLVHYGNISSDTNINESLATIQVEFGDTATTFEQYILPNINIDRRDIYKEEIDTGWVNMSEYVNTTYFAIRGGYPPMVRRIGNTCYWKGEVYCNNAPSGKVATILTNQIPSQFMPTQQHTSCGITYEASQYYNIFIVSGAGIQISQQSITTQSDYKGYQLSNLNGYVVDN